MGGNWISGYADVEAGALYHGDCREMLRSFATETNRPTIALAFTSPPYGLGLEYERRSTVADWVAVQRDVLELLVPLLAPTGSICWQVGTHVNPRTGGIVPLDAVLVPVLLDLGLTVRTRMVWAFRHGQHARHRLSGRHETVVWATKSNARGGYVFDLDPLRVPQRFPSKRHYRGPRRGELSCNPKGANPGDVWCIPNVRHNHPERTAAHPCQMPLELAERWILALTALGDLVLDPFAGVGTTVAAAVLHGRHAAGADLHRPYLDVAARRVQQAREGALPRRAWSGQLSP